jgi:hypothetical protein
MANPFSKSKTCPLEQDLTKAREDNANALDGLLGEIGAFLKGDTCAPKPLAAAEPRRAAAGRPWPPQRH